MKAISALTRSALKWLACALFPMAASLSISQPVRAQTVAYAISGVTLSTTNAATSSTYANIPAASGTISSGLSYTYNFTYGKATTATNNNVQLTGFIANGFTFTYSSAAPVVNFRRVNINTTTPVNVVTGKRVSLWFERASTNTVTTGSGTGSGGTAALLPDYTDDMETLFATRIFNIGIDNVFQNAITTNNNNIERVDVVFTNGLQATDLNAVGFAVFDRGPDGGNDSFRIAAIKTVDAGGNPSSYFAPVLIKPAMYGSGLTSPATSLTYHILRKEATDATLEIMTPNQGPQNRNGVLLTLSQLGVPASTTTYGYSIFAPDVAYASPADLVDYTNSSHFPNNSDLSGGGLDMVAVAGVAYTATSSLIILPVKVDYFNAASTGDAVQLNWELDPTDDLKELVLERSGNGTDFTPLLDFFSGFTGRQTGSDRQPLPGENDYRLKLVDADGRVAGYSQVCAVTMNPASVALDIYPNPVKDRQFTLDARGLKDNETYLLRLFNMNGALVFTQRLDGAPPISRHIGVSNALPPGIYTIDLSDKNGNRIMAKTLALE